MINQQSIFLRVFNPNYFGGQGDSANASGFVTGLDFKDLLIELFLFEVARICLTTATTDVAIVTLSALEDSTIPNTDKIIQKTILEEFVNLDNLDRNGWISIISFKKLTD